MPVASNQVSHATPPAFLLSRVSREELTQRPGFHGSRCRDGSSAPPQPTPPPAYERIPAAAGLYLPCRGAAGAGGDADATAATAQPLPAVLGQVPVAVPQRAPARGAGDTHPHRPCRSC